MKTIEAKVELGNPLGLEDTQEVTPIKLLESPLYGVIPSPEDPEFWRYVEIVSPH